MVVEQQPLWLQSRVLESEKWVGFLTIGRDWCERRCGESSFEMLVKAMREPPAGSPERFHHRSGERRILTRFYRRPTRLKRRIKTSQGFVSSNLIAEFDIGANNLLFYAFILYRVTLLIIDVLWLMGLKLKQKQVLTLHVRWSSVIEFP